MRTTLSKTVVDRLLPGAIAWDTKVAGLGARRQRGPAVNYVLKHKGRWFTIGRHGSPFTVEAARTEALRLLGQLVVGEDPRPEAPSGGTFGETVALYLERRKPAWRPRSYEEMSRHLLGHAKPLHGASLDEVSKRQIAELLAKVEAGSGPTARNRVRASLSAFFSWCIREGLLETNPVTGTGKAEERSRERVLSPAELGHLWRTQFAGQHVDFIDVTRLLLLTGQRRTEIGALLWSEVDFDAKLIRLPAERTKNHREHLVPLSQPAVDILRMKWAERDARSQCRGPGPKPNDARVFRAFSWNAEKRILDAGLGIAPWRLHDIRRSVATHLGELGIAQPHIVETLLNHLSGHRAGVAGVYQRARYENECRAALEAWAKWIEANAEAERLAV